MAKLKLGLSKRNPENLVALGKHVHPKIAPAAPAVPPVAGVADEAADLLVAIDEADAANIAYADGVTALEALRVAREEKADALHAAHDIMASALEAKSKGAEGPLSLTGYDLAGANSPATTPPAKIEGLVVTAGDNDGTVDVACDPDALASTYEWHVTTVDPLAGPYTKLDPTTASSTTLGSWPSGTRIWVKARGVGSQGPGPFSDPVSKIVP